MFSIERRIAWQFMLMGPEQGRFSPMTLFAWLAIGVGVGAMSSLLSVMYGFEAALRERVTSKGGTTYAAITSMESDNVKPAFIRALHAACKRADELGSEFGR